MIKLFSLKDKDSDAFERQREMAIIAQNLAARKYKIDRYYRGSAALPVKSKSTGKIMRYRQLEMPEAEFRRQFSFLQSARVDIVQSLAAIFSVPAKQVQIRCGQLGLEL